MFIVKEYAALKYSLSLCGNTYLLSSFYIQLENDSYNGSTEYEKVNFVNTPAFKSNSL